MFKDHISAWEGCLAIIKKQIQPQAFKTWFEPIRPVKLDGRVLTIQVPNKFFYEWLEEHYVSLLKSALLEELGDGVRLEYMVPKHSTSFKPVAKPDVNSAIEDSNSSPKVPGPGITNPENIQNPFIIPGIKKIKIASNLKSSYTFDNFIEGDCNRLARSAGIAVCKKPGETSFNPLFIFGQVGLGKTHLAQAIGNEVHKRFPDKNVLYVNADAFTNHFIDSLKNNAVNEFVHYYQFVDVLILDDIQFLANKQRTQDIFFHIFNHLHQNGKQLILTSDRPPKDLEGMEDRLISRFKWGLSADLGVPDFETRIAIIVSKMEAEGIEMPNNVAEFISYNIKSSIRELEGILVSMIAKATLEDKEIDMNLAKEVIKHFVYNISKEITIDIIQKVVAEYYNIPLDRMKEKNRKREIVMARQISMYMAKSLTNQSLKSIGEFFGGRDHSTVIYASKVVQDLMDTDPNFSDQVLQIEKKIKMSINN